VKKGGAECIEGSRYPVGVVCVDNDIPAAAVVDYRYTRIQKFRFGCGKRGPLYLHLTDGSACNVRRSISETE